MSDRKGEVSDAHVDPRERAPRTADHVEAAAAPALWDAAVAKRRAECLADAALVRRIDAQHSKRHRNAGRAGAVGDTDQLEAAAAEIAHHAMRTGDAGEDAFTGEARFFAGAQDLAVEADPVELAHELRSVGGVANGGGRHDAGLLHLHVIDEQLEAAECGERTLARFRGEPARPITAAP